MVRPFWETTTHPTSQWRILLPMNSGAKSSHQTPSQFCHHRGFWLTKKSISGVFFLSSQCEKMHHFQSPSPISLPHSLIRGTYYFDLSSPSRWEVKNCYHRTYLHSWASLAKWFCSIEVYKLHWIWANYFKGVSKNSGSPKWMVYNGNPY